MAARSKPPPPLAPVDDGRGGIVVGADFRSRFIEDYLAGRLIPETPAALDRIIKQINQRFDVVNVKDFMAEPLGDTGYTAIHFQVRLPNGLSAEIQVIPRPFFDVAERQRATYVATRDTRGRGASRRSDEQSEQLERSKEIFERAWEDWIEIGGTDRRNTR